MATVLVAAWASAASAAPPLERIVPDDTLVFLTVRNIPALQAKIKDQSVYALWQEPSVQKFLEKPLDRFAQELRRAEGKTGVTAAEVWSLLRGQAALAVSTDADATEPEILFMADVGDQGDKVMQVVATVLSTAAEKTNAPATTVVEEQMEGSRFVRVQPPAEAGGAAAEPRYTYGVAGDVFILGRPLSAVKRTAGFVRTPPAGLSGAPLYQAMLVKVSADSDLIGYVNLQRLTALGDRLSHSPNAAQTLNGLGLNGLAALGGGVRFASDYNTSQLFLQTTGTPRGLVKILMPTPGPLHTGAEIPPDAASFLSVRFDAGIIWDEVERIMAAVAPESLTALNAQTAEFSRQLGQPFSLRNDILSIFGPRLAVYTRFEKPYKLADGQQAVVMADISGKAAFNAALEKVRKVAPQLVGALQEKEYMGHQIYMLRRGDAAAPGQPPRQATAAFVATDKEFIFSSRLEALETHLRRVAGGGPSLADRPEFQEGMKALPAQDRVMVLFTDPSRQAEFLLTVLREGQLTPVIEMLKQDPDTAEVVNLFDLSLLPDPADVTKHLSATAACALTQPDGLMVISKSRAKAP